MGLSDSRPPGFLLKKMLISGSLVELAGVVPRAVVATTGFLVLNSDNPGLLDSIVE